MPAIPENKTEAVKWFCLSAEQENAEGQFMLGVCYVGGAGVQHDMTEAIKWLHNPQKENV